MKVLIFGGSFDPVHRGHVKLFSSAVKAIRPDVTHIVPAYHSPFKDKTPTPFYARMAMAKAAFGGIKTKLIFDDFEFKRGKKTYAHEVIKHLQKKYPGAEIFLLVGSDCLNEIKTWKNASYIFKNSAIVYGRRAKYEKVLKTDFKVVLLPGVFPPVSSHALRLKIIASGVVPAELKNVKQIIERESLYCLDVHAWLRKHLKENRYLHTKAVCELILKFAGKYGVNPNDAALAALLHDAGKSLTEKRLISYARENKIRLPYRALVCRYEPELLHSYVSADIAKKIFNIKNKEILKAIETHTLGGKKMGLLAKILYVADASSKDRKFKDAARIRALALTDLRAALLAATKMKLMFSIQTDKWLCPEGNKTWNRLVLERH